jgi:hypothetical protein
MDWIDLGKDKDSYLSLAYAVLEIQVSLKMCNILNI